MKPNPWPRASTGVTSALAVALLLAAPDRSSLAETPASAPAQSSAFRTLNVFAAASLTTAFQAEATQFERDHPSIKVQFNFGGSPTLVQQIQQGAPADVFASADEPNMQKLVDSKDIQGESQIFARNELAIAVAPGNPKHIKSLADLDGSGLMISLCGATVPCGRYATEAFGKAGVKVPAASQETDVKSVLNRVAMGEADAGLVYTTDIRAADGKVEGVTIPPGHNVVARYPIAVLKGAANPDAARQFVSFVLSPPGQSILKRFGFSGSN